MFEEVREHAEELRTRWEGHWRGQLSRLMEHRRDELGLTWEDVARAAGMVPANLRRIRRGEGELTEAAAGGIETALSWAPGSVASIAGGKLPIAHDKPQVAHRRPLGRGLGFLIPDEPSEQRQMTVKDICAELVRMSRQEREEVSSFLKLLQTWDQSDDRAHSRIEATSAYVELVRVSLAAMESEDDPKQLEHLQNIARLAARLSENAEADAQESMDTMIRISAELKEHYSVEMQSSTPPEPSPAEGTVPPTSSRPDDHDDSSSA
jgi:transcriptional regulator with XRE-family HTH domain